MSGRSRTLTIEILGDGKQASAAFDGVAQSADGMGSKLGSIAKVGAVAVASVGAAAVGLGVVAYKMGEQFDEAYDTIRVGTGATGDALEGLQDSFQNVVSSVPTDFNTASTAIADLNTRLGLTGKPLEEMATQFINLSRVTGEDLPTSIANGTRVFGDWSIATEDQGAALDHLFKVSQSTGIGVNDLMTKVVQFGAPLRQMGFGFEESSALMGKWEKEGVNAELVASSLRIALGKMANEGVTDTNAALTELQERIKNAGSEGEATAIAMDAFGAKAGPDMAAAIREGRFEVEDLMKSLEESGETINGVAGDTDDLGQKWTLLKNKAMVAFEPITSGIFNLAGSMMDKLLPVADKVLPAMVSGLQDIGAAFQEGGLSGALSEIGSKAADAFNAVDWGSIASAVAEALGDGLAAVAGFGERVAGWAAEQFAAVDWSGLGSTLIDGLLAGLEAATDFGSRAVGWISGQFASVDWTGLGTSLVNGLIAGLEAAVDFGSRAVGWISGQFAAVDWSGLGTALVDGLLAGLMAVADFGSRAASWIAEQFTSVDWSGLGTSLVDGVMAGITTVQDFGSRFAEWFQSGIQGSDWGFIGQTISEQLSGAMSGLTDLGPVQSLIDMFNTYLLPALQLIGEEIGSRVAPMVERFRTALADAGASISENLGPTLANLQEAWVALQPAIAAVLPVLEGLAVVVGGVLLAAFNGFLGILSGVLPNAVEAAFAVINGLITIFTGLVETVTGIVKILAGIFTGDWAKAWEGAQQVVSGMITAVTGLFEGLWGAVQAAVMAVVDGVIGLFEGLYHTVVGGSIIPDMINGIIEWFGRLPGEVIGILSGFVASALGFFTDLQATAISTISAMVTDVIAQFVSMASNVLSSISSMVSGAISTLSGFVGQAIAVAAETATGFVQQIGRLASEVPAVLSAMIGAAISSLSGFAGQLSQAAIDAVQGFVDGIYSMAKPIADAGAWLGSQASNALDTLLQRDSPSKLFREKGVDTAQGYIDGVISKESELASAGMSVGEQVLSGLLTALGPDAVNALMPSADAIARAMIEGAITPIKSEVEGVPDTFAVNAGRIPEIAAGIGQDTAMALMEAYTTLQGQFQIAALSGKDTSKIDAELAAIEALFEEWGQSVIGTATSVADAMRTVADADAFKDLFSDVLGDLEGVASGERAEKLKAEFDDLWRQLRIAKEEGLTDVVADLDAQMQAIEDELNVIGQVAGSAVGQGMTAAFEAEQVVTDWMERLATATSEGVAGVVEGLQSDLQALDDQILAAVLNPDVPAEVVTELQKRRAEASAELEQTMADLASAAAAGSVSPEVLAELVKAGHTQFEAILEGLVGKDATKKLLGGVETMSKAAIEELKTIFAEAPEIAADFIDDLVLGVQDGSIELADAMELLAMIPEEELTPALIDLKDTWTKQLAEAVVSGNTEMAESLRALIAWVEEFDASVQGANESVSKMNGNSYGWKSGGDGPAGLPSSGGSFGSGSGGGSGSGAGGAGMSDAQLAYYQDRSPGYQRWKALAGNEQIDPLAGREVTVVNNNTINIDGEPVAESVNKVNSRNLPTMMGPI